jgi:hypothetical protein
MVNVLGVIAAAGAQLLHEPDGDTSFCTACVKLMSSRRELRHLAEPELSARDRRRHLNHGFGPHIALAEDAINFAVGSTPRAVFTVFSPPVSMACKLPKLEDVRKCFSAHREN